VRRPGVCPFYTHPLQVYSVARIFDALSRKVPAVEHLTLEHEVHSQSYEEHNEVDHTEWRRLLGSFSSAKTIRIDMGSLGNSLVALNWTMVSSLWSCYPSYRHAQFQGAAMLIIDSPHSSMLARMQACSAVALARSPATSESSASSAPVITSGQGMTSVLETGSHTQATEKFILPPYYY
jgi:hypothetical protein